jgi:ethanolamine utilization cobalamin adenosyltransferase
MIQYNSEMGAYDVIQCLTNLDKDKLLTSSWQVFLRTRQINLKHVDSKARRNSFTINDEIIANAKCSKLK